MHILKKFVFISIIAGVLFFSCKKKTTEPEQTGAPVLKWKIEKIKTYNSPALGLDGIIYVFANDDTLYA